jgi:endonuclease/exonuclease/phosphatase family metal-dependent hydrolase
MPPKDCQGWRTYLADRAREEGAIGARPRLVRASVHVAYTALALVCVAGCATARNYADPSGPVRVGSVASPARAPAELRVVSFNVQFARHVDRAIALLNRSGPLKEADVLVLQEMDEPGTAAVARALGMNHVYVPSAVHPSSRRDFGVAILSPWPLEDARKVLLPHRHRFRKMRRSAAAATVRAPLGAVRVVAVHLETVLGGSGRVRRDQARAVAAEEAAWTGPIVIAGDFNGTGAARELARLGFTWLTRDVHDTAGPFDLDHIVVRGLCPTRGPPAAKAADPLKASDHRPVWTTLVPCRAPTGTPVVRESARQPQGLGCIGNRSGMTGRELVEEMRSAAYSCGVCSIPSAVAWTTGWSPARKTAGPAAARSSCGRIGSMPTASPMDRRQLAR